MRRFVRFAIAPMVLAGLMAAGCGSAGQDKPTTWNDNNPWGTQRASQAGGAMDAGTAATLPPPTTQPSK